MPPRRQNRRTVRDIELDELCQQVQRIQEIVEAQQAQLQQQEVPIFYHDSEESESSSSTNTNRRQHRFPTRNQFNDFKVNIPKFEGCLQLDEFVDWLHTVERVFELKEILDDQ